MSQISKVKAADLFPFISELVDSGVSARLMVIGTSMTPFLRDGIDSVELSKVKFETLCRGNIVLIRRINGTYVLHRVFRKKHDCFFMVGDAQEWIEGPLYPEQLVGVVTAIWRRERRIPCSNIFLKLLSRIWLLLRPCRYFIFKVYRKLRNLIKKALLN